jgi:hypothetical protein
MRVEQIAAQEDHHQNREAKSERLYEGNFIEIDHVQLPCFGGVIK